MPLLRQHGKHHNCMGKSCFPFKWNVAIMEPMNRLKCSTAFDFSSEMCVFVCVQVWPLACRNTSFSSTLPGAMSLPQYYLFIWQSLLSVTDMRSQASQRINEWWRLSLCLCPKTSQINSNFQSDKLRRHKSTMFQCDAIIHQFTWRSSFAI